MIRASYIARPLQFKRPAGTSRGVLKQKPCWYITLTAPDGSRGLGEVSFIPGLSVEDPREIEIQVDHVCKLISRGEMNPEDQLPSLPGIQFALETALKDMATGGTQLLFPSEFTGGKEGIATNGLIWMGDRSYMKRQIGEKLDIGFRVLKLKVGAIEMEEELDLLHGIRLEYGEDLLEIRLDANGAWKVEQARERIERFSEFGIHSIEQPIARGQIREMAALCDQSPIPVALDEELIGLTSLKERAELMDVIRPEYVILKPGLLGGFSVAEEWIRLAEKRNSGWWITSALESSLGLNSIAQWTYDKQVTIPQGLGVGTLYTNNIPSPLQMEGDQLWHLSHKSWDLQMVFQT